MTQIYRARLATLFAATALGFVAASPADALAIRLIDSASQIDVTDNGVGDNDPLLGSIDYDSTAVGSPQLTAWGTTSAQVSSCSVECPSLALSLEGNSLGDNGTLSFMVTETDLTLAPSRWLGQHSLGGFAADEVTVQAYWDPSNAAFGAAETIGGLFEFTASGDTFDSFAKDYFASIDGASPFSMTTIVTFRHALGDTQSSATSKAVLTASDVPLPAALPMLGAGLAGMGIVARKRRAKAA